MTKTKPLDSDSIVRMGKITNFVKYLVLALIFFFVGYRLGGDKYKDITYSVEVRPDADDQPFAFLGRERGNVEAMQGTGPREPPLKKKRALVAIAAGETSKERVDALITQLGFEDASFILFHWDQAEWSEYEWYRNVTAIRKPNQTKFWFAKRFLTPDIVENYQYLLLWDDDFGISEDIDIVEMLVTMEEYNIHFAQPALTKNWHWPVSSKSLFEEIGRFTDFVEMMFPIFSSEAWSCAWGIIPYDSKYFWGMDKMWLSMCGSQGFCRMAVLDKFSIRHEGRSTLGHGSDAFQEMNKYVEEITKHCHREEWNGKRIPIKVKLFCDVYQQGSGITEIIHGFDSIKPKYLESNECPSDVFGRTRNKYVVKIST